MIAAASSPIHEQGTTSVTFTDIARAMEVTPPALYRYFADHHELLTDGYDDLGRAVAEARDAVPADDLAGRWLAAAQGYRQWATREPQQFALIFGLPVPGYVATQEGPDHRGGRARDGPARGDLRPRDAAWPAGRAPRRDALFVGQATLAAEAAGFPVPEPRPTAG